MLTFPTVSLPAVVFLLAVTEVSDELPESESSDELFSEPELPDELLPELELPDELSPGFASLSTTV